jgi:hypothetical protein
LPNLVNPIEHEDMKMPDQSSLLAQCRTAFCSALVAAVAEVGIRSPALIDCLSQNAGRAFDELAGLHSQEDYKKLRGVTASRISLVHPEDMDLTVTLINLSHDLADACERQLPRVHLLFMSLLGQDSSVLDQLPVGPDAVCVALRAMCDQGELVGEARLDLPARVQDPLIHSLRALYSQLTEMLQAAGVEPKSLLRPSSEGGRSGPGYGPLGGDLREVDGRGYSAGGQESLNEAQQYDSPLDRLQGKLLKKRGDGTPGGGSGGNGGGGGSGNTQIDPTLIAAIVERVVVWLSERQQAAAAQPYGTGGPTPNFGELSALLPANNNAALDAIGMSFDVLLADPTICPAIKPSLDRLRLPLSKLALVDPQVLTDLQHPARQFIDSMLRAGLSLPASTTSAHPVCQAIEAAAHNVQQNFQRDLGIFGEAKSQIDILNDTQRHSMARRCLPLIPVAEREAQREHSRSRAARAIRALCAENVPRSVQTFLELLWVRVLAAIHQHSGEKSEAWRRALSTANQLVESVQPRADAVARQQFVASLPGLIAQLREGLEAIGAPEALRERAFQSFVDCHKAVILGRPLPTTESNLIEISTEARIENMPNIDGLRIVRLPPDAEHEHGDAEWLDALVAGQWLQLKLPDETDARRLCIGWTGGTPRLLLATEPGSDFAIIFPLRWLDSLAVEGRAMPFAPDGAFEHAAETAIDRYH